MLRYAIQVSEDEKNLLLIALKEVDSKVYVFVKDGDKNKKVTWGDTTGLSVKLKNPEARKSFSAWAQMCQQR